MPYVNSEVLLRVAPRLDQAGSLCLKGFQGNLPSGLKLLEIIPQRFVSGSQLARHTNIFVQAGLYKLRLKERWCICGVEELLELKQGVVEKGLAFERSGWLQSGG